ncbi:MAG: hypothetical protein AAB570_04570 [Patescibacteria group bacterium]
MNTQSSLPVRVRFANRHQRQTWRLPIKRLKRFVEKPRKLGTILQAHV